MYKRQDLDSLLYDTKKNAEYLISIATELTNYSETLTKITMANIEEIRDKIFHLLLRPKWSPCKGGNALNWFWHMEGLEKEHFFNSYLLDFKLKKVDSFIQKRRKLAKLYQKLLENTSVGPDESLSFSPIVAGASDYVIGRSTAASVNMVMMGHDE